MFFRQMYGTKLNVDPLLLETVAADVRCLGARTSFRLLRRLLKLIICCSKSSRNH